MKTIFLFCLTVISCLYVSAQDEFYGPHHDYVRDAMWKSDGTQFLTRGLDAFINVWRDSDGLLLLELDHSSFLSPYAGDAHITKAAWNDDETAIITEAYTKNDDFHVLELAWSAQTGDLIYSYVVASHSGHAPYRPLSQKLNSDVVVTWADDHLTVLDIDLESGDVGMALESIPFENQIITQVQWTADLSRALVKTHPLPTDDCYRCTTDYYLIDMDLESESFSQILWQTHLSTSAAEYVWQNQPDYLAIHGDSSISLWNLDIDSSAFGTQVFSTASQSESLETILLFDENLLVIAYVENLGYVEGAHPMAGPQCIDDQCTYNIQTWDTDTSSQLADVDYIFEDNSPHNSIHINSSGSQLHVATTVSILTDAGIERTDSLIAYDLPTLATVEPVGIIPVSEPELPPVEPTLQVNLSNLTNADDYYPIAVNPDHTKVLVGSFTRDLIFIFDLETGEWLLPRMLG